MLILFKSTENLAIGEVFSWLQKSATDESIIEIALDRKHSQ